MIAHALTILLFLAAAGLTWLWPWWILIVLAGIPSLYILAILLLGLAEVYEFIREAISDAILSLKRRKDDR